MRVAAPFPVTVSRVRAALGEQGFGVLTEIDVRATLQQKLGVQMEEYLILGACNPAMAHRALDTDRDGLLLLPCNVVVRADGPDTTLVQALEPRVMVQVSGQPRLRDVADEATTRLHAALDTLAERPPRQPQRRTSREAAVATTPADPSAIVELHLARAERASQDTAGGRSMCAIGRSGQSLPAAKYHEGATGALRHAPRHPRAHHRAAGGRYQPPSPRRCATVARPRPRAPGRQFRLAGLLRRRC